MLLKKKKPVTPGQRHQIKLIQNLFLTKPRLKYQTKRKPSFSGRNHTGVITIGNRGSNKSRKLWRKITKVYNNFEGIVVGLEKDPNRTACIARVFDLRKKIFIYLIATKNMYPGTKIYMGDKHHHIRIGNRLPLGQVPAGSIISLVGKKKFLFASSAGTFCQLLQKNNITSKLRVPSGKIIFLNSDIPVTLGSVSNDKHALQVFGKAGYSRNKGFRPIVRGVAKNPVDHPHGGGGGKPSVTPWGKPTKGKPTRKTQKIKI